MNKLTEEDRTLIKPVSSKTICREHCFYKTHHKKIMITRDFQKYTILSIHKSWLDIKTRNCTSAKLHSNWVHACTSLIKFLSKKYMNIFLSKVSHFSFLNTSISTDHCKNQAHLVKWCFKNCGFFIAKIFFYTLQKQVQYNLK